MVHRGFAFFLLALLAAALVAGCGGSSASPRYGTANVYVTDQPASPYSGVFVTIKRIDLVSESGTIATVVDETQQVELLALDNAQVLLESASVPEGRYSQLRLVLSAAEGDNYVVLAGDGSRQDLLLSSQAQTGLKLVGDIPIAAGTTTNILLDFDASRSIVEQGNGKLRLKPVVQVVCESHDTAHDGTDGSPLGEIAGQIAPEAALPSVQVAAVNVDTGATAAQGTVQQSPSDGSFLPDFELDVPPGTYQLVVTADGFQAYASSQLSPPVTFTVTADQTTPAGLITLVAAP